MKIQKLIILLLGCLLFFSKTPLIAEEKFSIGVNLALSGPLMEYGEAVRNGIEFARIQNQELFSKITFIYEDDQYLPKKAVLNFSKLVHVDKVKLLFTWGTESAL